jgi:effector-binding domain-containing protein
VAGENEWFFLTGEGSGMTETVRYDVTETDREIEFRRYPALVLATVDDPGDDSGFSTLFSYITGNNRAQGKIPMTAPVITAEKLPMIAPVISDSRTISFVMPAGKDRNELPEPLDTRVKILTTPQREMAVIRFKGYAGKDEVASYTSRLLDGLKKSGITTVGRPVLMRYNAPWTPGFLRRNEVAVEVNRQGTFGTGST